VPTVIPADDGTDVIATIYGPNSSVFTEDAGQGREGGIEGLRPYLEVKTVILEGRPESYRS
jgi:hypothetical protein